jgi:hypothetical protein
LAEHRPNWPAAKRFAQSDDVAVGDNAETHHFDSGKDLEQTLLRDVKLYNHQLPQTALKSNAPFPVLKDWCACNPLICFTTGRMILWDATTAPSQPDA